MVTYFRLVIVVLLLSVSGQSFREETARREAVAPIAGIEIRPLTMVTSSVSHGLASLRSQRGEFKTDGERRAEIRRAADELFDVDEIARRALGQHWKGLLPLEQREYVRLFQAVLTQSFMMIVQRYTGDPVASVDEKVAGTFAEVHSRITPDRGPDTTIVYRLSRRGSQWTVYDVVLDGVSLVSNYRSQFNVIIATSSVAQLFERMRTEPSRQPYSPDGGTGATIAEPETSARGRLAAGLLLGAAANARWR